MVEETWSVPTPVAIADGPLSGLVVADFSRILAGPYASMLLADLGAVVVGEGDAAVPSVRNPITFSATPASCRLPPPELDEHGEELRKWLAGPR